ncbi:hypothetical protein CMV_018188 [Castanea mollissima]|uniref:Uncharacterized protein n=1 Tax=Castanea mollissima TaxID=60419 RepID=A0A8J4VGE4_9ROSI|nr:hypothetical protein CMV_018188 [Castanea mollissima]
MGETNTVRFARACPSYTKLAWLTNHAHALQVPARMGRRHAEARWSPWDLLRAAMGETNTVRFARACPSYTKLAWLTNHAHALQVPARMGRRHAEARWSPWDLLRAAMGETNTVRFAKSVPKLDQACVAHQPHAGTTSSRIVRKTRTPQVVAMELASRSNG